MRGLWDAWRDVLDFLLEAARQSGNRAAEAFLLHQSGVREIGVGARQKALDLLYQALRIRQALGDTIGKAYTQHNIDFLIGPPPPPRNNQPEPPSPAPVPAGGTLLLVVGTLAVLAFLGLGFLGIMGPFLFRSPTLTPSVTNMQTDTPTSLPTETPTNTPTDTPTPTPTPTQAIPVLNLNLRVLSETVFLYQGLESDYFDVPIWIGMNNPSSSDISSFDFSIRYEGYNGSDLTMFRIEGQNTYFISTTEQGIPAGTGRESKATVMIPRYYEGTTVQIMIVTDRCQKDIECHANGSSVTLPIVIRDFVDSAPGRKWLGYDPNLDKEYDLIFNGPDVDPSQGSVSLASGKILEDGSQPFYVLATHPTWVPRGTIEGLFGPGFASEYPRKDDLLIVRIGFIGGGGGDGVTFHINCFGRDPSGKPFNTSLVNLYDSSDGNIRDAIMAFGDPKTECTEGFSLWVDAGSSSGQDWAVWLSAYIARYAAGGAPSPPATSTSQPASATPTVTPFPTATSGPIIY